MKKRRKTLRKQFINKRTIIIAGTILIIGIISTSSFVIYNNFKKARADAFRTLYSDEEASPSGQIAGAATEITPTATARLYRVFSTPIRTAVNQHRIINTIVPTKQSSQLNTNSNPTNTPVPQATSVSVASTNTPLPNSPTPGPTSTPAATPTPSFSGSIHTGIEGDTLKVNVDANKTLKICNFQFYGVSGSSPPVTIKTSSPNGTSCSSENGKNNIEKVKVTIAADDGSQTDLEQSGPFE